jgi:hypothetical protein
MTTKNRLKRIVQQLCCWLAAPLRARGGTQPERVKRHAVREIKQTYALREQSEAYAVNFTGRSDALRAETLSAAMKPSDAAET